ncbi:MAG: endopeptidase La [Deltaproteobacteria bacterium]|nr:endopeptidase La [Deltaproteobacteria bacterium]MBW1951533.1 endopeptidase La [Deltaproteobacteria bacterium]MBW1987354.1 endopeptidase La [Deltaproteobacteria bacterium]MBW2135200.1 endopeptidase La [Deltaproteobacteria bacterium]
MSLPKNLKTESALPEIPAATEAEASRLLPILPMNELVLFPRVVIPLTVWEDSAQHLVDETLLKDKIIGILASRQPTIEAPTLENLHKVGTAAVILKMGKTQDDVLRLLIQGLYRFRVEEVVAQEPYLQARVTPISEDFESDMEIEAMVSNVKGLFLKMLELSPYLPTELGAMVREIDDPRVLADVIGGSMNIAKNDKQNLLETIDVKERLRKVLSLVNREMEILELGKKIQNQVKGEIDKAQRDYYLREQIKALQKELGEVDDRTREIEELRTRLEDSQLPEAAFKEAERELNRLSRIPPTSPDHQVIRTYLEWMIELPWNVATEDNLDLQQARRILDEDHYDLEKVKKRILEYLAVRKLKPDMKGPILCFVGPPGTGKTSLGKSIARALGRKFVRMSLGGVRDEAEIRGHRRTYVGALPGRIIQSIRRAGSNNPVFILDEIDKIGADFRGDPSSALLEVLDPEQNFSFSDHYLEVGFDLSKVMFLTTANMLDTIPPALRDRMEVLELPGYTEEEKLQIAYDYLLPRQLAAHGLQPEQLEITPEAMRRVIAEYTREAGLRNLEREIAALCRGVAREIAEGLCTQKRITEAEIPAYLGPLRFYREPALEHPEPGVATGLAWTPTGGEILFIEALRMPGNSRLKLTGQLGEVMKESADAALSYIRARGPYLGVAEDFFDKTDIHIHVPAGAIPKDGPSAGVAMLTALVSLLSDRPVKKGLAMTGEITLRGHVLPVGGIKDKVLAAHRAGLREIILPARNDKDLEEIPENVKKRLKFHLVERMDQVLEIAFSNHPPKLG